MSGVHALIASAFGNSACLYADVLRCKRTATSSELRKAYHKRALLFHPDKRHGRNESVEENRLSTLRFQAVSTAYETLADPQKRKLYDATGDLDKCNTCETSSKKNEDQWTEFFRSVFREVVAAGSQYDRTTYCNSEEEKRDVLKFYEICKGDLNKVLTCIVLGQQTDKQRWVDSIIEPAIRSGKVERFDGLTHRSDLGDTDNERQSDTKGNRKRKRIKKVRRSENSDEGLIDTDEENEEDKKRNARIKRKELPTVEATMTKKDRMEYRVAKKQKEKKEKDIELSNLMKNKSWDSGIGKQRRTGTFNDNLLSSLERKYSEVPDDAGDRKKTAKKKRRSK